MAEDFSNLSDEELDKLVAKKMTQKAVKKDFSQMSDEELDSAIAEKQALEQERLMSPMELVGGTALGAYKEIEPYVKPIYPYVAPVAKGVGAGLEFAGDVLSYLDAPMKQAAMAPKRLAEGEVAEAITKPFTQILSSPSQAPSWKQVAESYGVPEQQTIAPFELAQPLFPTSFEKGQMAHEQAKSVISTPEKQKQYEQLIAEQMPTTFYPSEFVETAAESALGGKGLGLTIEGLKRTGKGLVYGAGKLADIVSGSKLPSELTKQTVKSLESAGTEIGKTVQEILDPTLVNQPKKLSEGQKSVAEKIFGKDIPSPIKYTEGSEINRLEKALADKAGGGELVQKHNNAVNKIHSYVRNIPQKIAKSTAIGVPLDRSNAGQYIQRRFNEIKNDVFKNVDLTRRSYAFLLRDPKTLNFAPVSANASRNIALDVKMMKSELSGLKVGKDNPLAKQVDELNYILDDLGNKFKVEKIANPNDPGSFVYQPQGTVMDLANTIDSVGKLAFDERYSEVLDKKKLQELYHKLNNNFLAEVQVRLGKEAKENLMQNNKAISEFLQKTEPIRNALKNESPDVIFEKLINKGNYNDLQSIKNTFDSEDISVLKASLLDQKLAKKEVIGEVPTYSWRSLEKDITDSNGYVELFDKSEKPEIMGAIRLGKQMGTPYASKSGTGLSLGYQQYTPRVIGNMMLERQKNVMEGISKPLIPEIIGKVSGPAEFVPLYLQKQNIVGPSKMENAQRMMFDALMNGMQPHQIDPQIQNSQELTPTEKAQLRKKLTDTIQ